jgi:hypothetical protein
MDGGTNLFCRVALVIDEANVGQSFGHAQDAQFVHKCRLRVTGPCVWDCICHSLL